MRFINQWIFVSDRSQNHGRILIGTISLFICLLISGCETATFYGQAVSGQMEMTLKRKKIDKLVNDPKVDSSLREKLLKVGVFLDFAEKELMLEHHGSYRHYVDLERDHVVWNVFAAPALSMQPNTWCYPLAGCLAYRGYFREDRARDYAARLDDKGFDTWVGGVTAYSTLGWLNDPVTNVLAILPEAALAETLFHELAHQEIFAMGDTEFNESYATAVALIGIKKLYGEEQGVQVENGYRVQEAFIEFILGLQEELKIVYQSDKSEKEKLEMKKQKIEKYREEYKSWRQQWGEYTAYDEWMADELNNAKLITVSSYNRMVPVFIDIYSKCGNDIECFYDRVKELKRMKKDKRKEYLENRLETQDE